jgi:hypothetical protein
MTAQSSDVAWLYDPVFWDMFCSHLRLFDDAHKGRMIAQLARRKCVSGDRIEKCLHNYLRGYVAEMDAKVCRGTETIN